MRSWLDCHSRLDRDRQECYRVSVSLDDDLDILDEKITAVQLSRYTVEPSNTPNTCHYENRKIMMSREETNVLMSEIVCVHKLCRVLAMLQIWWFAY